MPYRESSESSDGSESPGSPGGSSLERAAMVPSSLEHALGVSSTDSSTPQPGPESSGTGSTRVDPPAGHMAYLREKFSDSSFWRTLQTCCWPPGGPSQASPMTHTSENGLAGVLHEVQIPFQDL